MRRSASRIAVRFGSPLKCRNVRSASVCPHRFVRPPPQPHNRKGPIVKYSETLSVLGRLTLLLAVVAIAVPGRTAKLVLLSVLLLAGVAVAVVLFLHRRKPKAPPKHFTPNEINALLETCGTDDAPLPRLEKLVNAKSESELSRHGKVACGDRVVFDITVCRSKNFQGKRYYRVSSERDASEKEYFIKDDPADRAVYLFSLDPAVREYTDEVPTTPEDDTFHPWKEFDSLDDYIGNSIPRKSL